MIDVWKPTIELLRESRLRFGGFVESSPLLRARNFEQGSGRVYLKLENLQRTGSFKVRGAFNAVAKTPEHLRPAGFVARSSGNFGQALALACREIGIADCGNGYPCTVCTPLAASEVKTARMKRLGAQIERGGRDSAELENIARDCARRKGATFIHPYDNIDVIEGHASIGLEIVEDYQHLAKGAMSHLGAVVVPVGGGGLAAGVGSAMRATGFSGSIVGVEPNCADDTRQSLAAGYRLRVPAGHTTCDGLLAVEPGEITFPILKDVELQVVTVSEEQVKRACLELYQENRLVVEPSGAVGVAAYKSLALAPCTNGHRLDVVIVVSGGNVDLPQLLADAELAG